MQVFNSGADTRKTGSIYNIKDTAETFASDNEWFDLRITVRDKTITTYVNGKKAAEWEQPASWQPSSKVPNARLNEGSVGFQSMAGEVWFKDIHIVVP